MNGRFKGNIEHWPRSQAASIGFRIIFVFLMSPRHEKWLEIRLLSDFAVFFESVSSAHASTVPKYLHLSQEAHEI